MAEQESSPHDAFSANPTMVAAPHHLVLVGTRQLVSNLGPLFEFYRDGDSVWLIQPESLDPAPAERMRDLLMAEGITCRAFRRNFPDDLNEAAAWGAAALADMDRGHGGKVILIANGGTKPMMRTIERALGARVGRVIYGEGEPVRLLEIDSTDKVSTRPYTPPPVRRFVGLKHVLTCSGHSVSSDKPGRQLWSVNGPTEHACPDIHSMFFDEQALAVQYDGQQARLKRLRQEMQDLWDGGKLSKLLQVGVDKVESTAQVLGTAAARSALEHWSQALDHFQAECLRQRMLKRTVGAATFMEDLRSLRIDLVTAERSVDEVEASRDPVQRAALVNPANRVKMLEKILGPLWGDPCDIPVKVRGQVFKAAVGLHWVVQSGMALGGPATLEHMGEVFELAVARRLCDVVVSDVELQGVLSEVWHGVHVRGPSQQLAAEWDVLFVLRNGVLLNVECKSWRDRKKEFDARHHMIHEGASALADVWACSPLPTALCDRDWFADMQKFRSELQLHQRVHLAYTLPGQPEHYRWSGATLRCPSLEDQFRTAMSRYIT